MNEEVFQKAYEALNSEQKKAVDAIEGPVLVVAGPGSGKTQILSLRIGNILLKTDTRASNILCLTFTESAAANMRERLFTLIGTEAYHVAIHTFHSFCIEVMRRYPEYFYGGAFFYPADPISQIEVLEEIIKALPHDNPLRAFHSEQGFIYRSAIQTAIRDLKSAGLSPEAFSTLLHANNGEHEAINDILASAFSERLSIKLLPTLQESAKKLLQGRELSKILGSSLEAALGEAEELGKTSPVAEWKDTFLKKDDEGRNVFKDSLYAEKMHALAGIYEAYQRAMHERGFYDFDDMLLDVISALEKNPALRYEIQEQFQYVLIDEFQDTNNAQMKIVTLITDAAVHEERPNVMAVGDDDQAVYKFQGAEISNILDFSKRFRDPTVVTMTGNYRSTQPILDAARSIIVQGQDRLENRIKGMNKTLASLVKSEDVATHLAHYFFPSQAHEYTWVARKVATLIKEGISPESIAVITRKHKELTALVPFLKNTSVPIRYEREQNVFDEPHIREIIVIARFLFHSLSGDIETADSFLPTILSFPFWGIKREEIWNVSVHARKNHIPWLAAAASSSDPALLRARGFLLEASVVSQFEPLEKMIDRIVGGHVPVFQESEDEHDADDEPKLAPASSHGEAASPFREFYFSKKNFESKRAEYLAFLSSLRVFIATIREYRQGKTLGIGDLVEFVDIHEKNGISLHDRSPFANAAEAVTLMTAHKAKGLEFDHVFILSCQQDVWAPRNQGSKLPFPVNLPIARAGDTFDDQLRLFYVALTRARKALYLSSYDLDEKGKASPTLSFLADVQIETVSDTEEIPDTHDVLTSEWLSYHTPPFFGEERALLSSLLSDYAMSVTHLNNFLDVTKGGPQYFLEQNLLRFPQAKTVPSSYGSAIHKTIERVYVHLKAEGALPSSEIAVSWFEAALKRERLASADEKTSLQRGRSALTSFLNRYKETFDPAHKVEVDFAKQGVIVPSKQGPIPLSGKIDKLMIHEGEAEVYDWKTGRPKNSWKGTSEYEKIQLHNYARQLLFYKLLVEGSRDFSALEVKRGALVFVEPLSGKEHDHAELMLDLEEEAVERVADLIKAVHAKIIALDFPDVSHYEQSLSGILAFEEDLLSQ